MAGEDAGPYESAAAVGADAPIGPLPITYPMLLFYEAGGFPGRERITKNGKLCYITIY